jgi:hypothetical protein
VLARYGARLRVSASPDLEFNSFTQYDNSSRQLGSDIRIRWTFDSNRLSAKLQYALRY